MSRTRWIHALMSVAVLAAGGNFAAAAGPVSPEPMGRGLMARPIEDGKVYLGWRLLASDPADVAFNIYRRTGGTATVKLNNEPMRHAAF